MFRHYRELYLTIGFIIVAYSAYSIWLAGVKAESKAAGITETIATINQQTKARITADEKIIQITSDGVDHDAINNRADWLLSPAPENSHDNRLQRLGADTPNARATSEPLEDGPKPKERPRQAEAHVGRSSQLLDQEIDFIKNNADLLQ